MVRRAINENAYGSSVQLTRMHMVRPTINENAYGSSYN